MEKVWRKIEESMEKDRIKYDVIMSDSYIKSIFISRDAACLIGIRRRGNEERRGIGIEKGFAETTGIQYPHLP